ncbi:hypothetical protein ANDROMEDA_4 [Bacillus phage Andromeda]|uniref:Uncharacterized protein n=2 Tax=Andromedavirus andromeda TaxID=1273739 RepID=M1IEJ5_9CAUD|nr:hypothetical protein I905_gp04 [Bacillus phage Andromeda]AGE60843.1 hypothetical protein GEMINI_4 [Bacillus phage Gemini]AGE61074.1 hypothetical protein ANDROMEDA_4 [Bacillus phage Andromeda]
MMQELGGNIIAILVWVLLVTLLISFVIGIITIMFSLLRGNKEKPLCKHNYVVCDYRPSNMIEKVDHPYVLCCTMCGNVRHVNDTHMEALIRLGLLEKEDE